MYGSRKQGKVGTHSKIYVTFAVLFTSVLSAGRITSSTRMQKQHFRFSQNYAAFNQKVTDGFDNFIPLSTF